MAAKEETPAQHKSPKLSRPVFLSVLMYRLQQGVFREMGLRVRRNPSGYLMYIFHLERRW
jgi:hypothetical protein